MKVSLKMLDSAENDIIPEIRILRLTFYVKVSLKMLISADNDSFSDLISVYLTVFDH